MDFSKIDMPEMISIASSGNLDSIQIPFINYTQKCRDFFMDYFSIDFRDHMFNENIRFPPAYMCKCKLYDVAAKFQFHNTILITDYNLVEHCKMLHLDLDEIYDHLKIELSSIENEDNQFLLFDYEKKCIYIVHCSEADSEEGAQKDLRSGDNYCRLLSFVFSIVLGINQSYINMVAAPQITKECENPLVLSKYHLDEMHLEDKLLELNSYIEDVSAEPPVPSNGDCQTTILAVSYIFSFLATRKMERQLLSGTVTEKLLCMWLTKEQVKVVFSEKLWRIVTGGYGSGKSVVTRFLLEHLVKHATEPVDIYFVLFDNDSLLLKSLETFVKRIKDSYLVCDTNVIVGNCKDIEKCLFDELGEICGNQRKGIPFTISNIMLAMIKKAKSSKRKFHLIIDELDGEVIDSVEAATLKGIFKNNNGILKDSHVLFSIRSMEKKRVNVVGTQRIEHDSFRCYKDCGMEVMSLSFSMRTSKQVFKLIQVSMEGITCPNRILQPQQKSSTNAGKWSKFIRFIKSHLPQNKDDAKEIPESSKPNFVAESDSQQETGTSSSLKASKELQVQHTNPDEIDSVALDHDRKYQGSNAAIETEFVFHQFTDCGHNLYGRQPVLVFLDQHEKDNLPLAEKTVLLSIALDRHCYKMGKRNEKRMIICNTENEYQMCVSALVGLRKDYVLHIPGVSDYQSFDGNSLEGKTVITNYIGSRGMEFSQVVVLVNPEEHFKRQFFIEMIARCTDHLILIVPYHYDEKEYGGTERESMGTIVRKLCDHNQASMDKLLEVFLYVLTEHSDKDYPHAVSSSCYQSKRTTIRINLKNAQHKRYSEIGVLTELPSIPKPDENSALRYMQPESVKDLHVRMLSEGLIELSWNHPNNTFQVARTKCSISASQHKDKLEIIHSHFHGDKLQLPVEKGLSYKFQIHAISKYGGLLSLPNEIRFLPNNLRSQPSSKQTTSVDAKRYTFDDLRNFIHANQVSPIRNLLKYDISILKMKGESVGSTLLMRASCDHKPSIVEMFVEHGVDVEQTDDHGRTVLHCCAMYNSIDCLNILVPIAPPHLINHQDDDMFTALHHASWYGYLECVRSLLLHGADSHIEDRDGRTAYAEACGWSGDDETKRRIREVLLQYEKNHP